MLQAEYGRRVYEFSLSDTKDFTQDQRLDHVAAWLTLMLGSALTLS